MATPRVHTATQFRAGWSELQVSLSNGKIYMNRLIVPASAVVSCLLLLACATPTQISLSGLVVSDVTVISPERAAPLTHAYVRIVDGKIAEVSNRPVGTVKTQMRSALQKLRKVLA